MKHAAPTPAPAAFRPGRHLDLMDDPMHDPYFVRGKLAGTAACSDCGVVFHGGRWQWPDKPEHAHLTRCPACRRIHDDMPAGWVSMEGEFVQAHATELLELARNLEKREKAEHPLQRIIAVTEEAVGAGRPARHRAWRRGADAAGAVLVLLRGVTYLLSVCFLLPERMETGSGSARRSCAGVNSKGA